MKVIFFGTPIFAAEVLEFLMEKQIDVVAIISKPDRAKGRTKNPVATPVKLVAQKYPHIPLYQPEIVSELDFAQTLKDLQADLFVVVAYGEIIKQHLLDMPPSGCINLHASLLPKYRGAAPIQRCIIDGQVETGVTIMHMVRKMDAGDMIHSVKTPIGPETNFGEVEQTLCDIGKEALLHVILNINSKTLPQEAQDHSLATLAPKIELEDCEIQWNLPAETIHNLVRGVCPYPGAWCWVKLRQVPKRLKINKTRVIPYPHHVPGTILNPEHLNANLIIACGDNAVELLEVQLEGRKLMSSAEFMRGVSRDQLQY